MTGVNPGLPSLLFWYSLKRICKFLFPTIVFTFVLFKYFDSYELEFDIWLLFSSISACNVRKKCKAISYEDMI